MLKKFFLNTLSSFVGAWVALVLFGVVAVLVMVGIFAKIGLSHMNKEGEISKGSILRLELSGPIQETEKPKEIDYFSLMQGKIERYQTLAGLVQAIRTAKNNDYIEAIYLKCDGIMAAPATVDALRDALMEFKESGKKIIAYSNNLGMSDYYVATVADEIYLNPQGTVGLQGISGTTLFYKGLLDKLGIEFQVVKVGTYKSAVEPYINSTMSGPARAQLDTLYNNIWNYILDKICENRKSLTPEIIDSLVSKDFIFLKPAVSDLKNSLVDHLAYERSMDSIIAARLDKDKDKLNFVGPELIDSQEITSMAYDSKNQIAVLYATGQILDGGGSSVIDYIKLVPVITSLADNDKVKGMVLRVNSPGGSVFGSDQIGDALDYFQSKGKPLAVSMGDYAASGGYWISCCADRIFADPLTITGSIGIFGLIPNVEGLVNKLGLNFETVSTNPSAQFPSFIHRMTAEQQAAMQEMVERGYDQFVKRVADGRKMSEQKVRRIGEGRVYDAMKAMELGLVDQLGGLSDAIEWVAEKASLENYGVPVFPRVETTVWDFLPELLDTDGLAQLKGIYGENVNMDVIKFLWLLTCQKPLQARMVYGDFIFNTQF